MHFLLAVVCLYSRVVAQPLIPCDLLLFQATCFRPKWLALISNNQEAFYDKIATIIIADRYYGCVIKFDWLESYFSRKKPFFCFTIPYTVSVLLLSIWLRPFTDIFTDPVPEILTLAQRVNTRPLIFWWCGLGTRLALIPCDLLSFSSQVFLSFYSFVLIPSKIFSFASQATCSHSYPKAICSCPMRLALTARTAIN